ncbi:hypothetical protein BESB_024430 [Besnoitia besnoiti]|uniref:Uncharacterized protein n=1 Tax=Besnoitia besnoiti TaxID=94643 RepID=A0A2A9M6L5_BESBE|nr:hypothetical protein BESB_024430 [Besnoitia besnoiti]PFH31951.1 hypothetical protein BESB_024430 [Besnoitia besnoiti]
MKVKSTKLNRTNRGVTLLETARMSRRNEYQSGNTLVFSSLKASEDTSPRPSYAEVARCAESPERMSDESPNAWAASHKGLCHITVTSQHIPELNEASGFQSADVPVVSYADIVKRPQSPTYREPASMSDAQMKQKSYAHVSTSRKVVDELESSSAAPPGQHRSHADGRMPSLLSSRPTGAWASSGKVAFSKQKQLPHTPDVEFFPVATEKRSGLLKPRGRRNRKANASRSSSGAETKWAARSQNTATPTASGTASCPVHYLTFMDETAAVINEGLKFGLVRCLLSAQQQVPEDHSERGLTHRRVMIEERPWHVKTNRFPAGMNVDNFPATGYSVAPSKAVRAPCPLGRLSIEEWKAAVAITMHLYTRHAPRHQLADKW